MYKKSFAAVCAIYLCLLGSFLWLMGNEALQERERKAGAVLELAPENITKNSVYRGQAPAGQILLTHVPNRPVNVGADDAFFMSTEGDRAEEGMAKGGMSEEGRAKGCMSEEGGSNGAMSEEGGEKDAMGVGELWNDEEKAYPESEIRVLERIVEAEAGGEDADGKLLVANVVLNRVKHEAFPNTISEVVFQKSKGVTQFSPVANGRYEAVTVSEESRTAVERALSGEDISEGALYFAARKYADQKSMRWFDQNLTMLFKHGGHEFFK